MVDRPRQESDLRSQWKCSKCREKKIKVGLVGLNLLEFRA